MNYYKITSKAELDTYIECKVNDQAFTGEPDVETKRLKEMFQVAGEVIYVNKYVAELRKAHQVK
jgi:hypothetical protein